MKKLEAGNGEEEMAVYMREFGEEREWHIEGNGIYYW